ncbi:MAG: hypothetical protein K2Y39_15695 [Candidatus Obscuribacterales bacterium]|nr:hypothetical protein [Candidatus Obscuribacterales bacterium]
MPDSDEWRLQGQESYLKGVSLRYKRYVMRDEKWDHDHCSFCWAKFMDEQNVNALPDCLYEGYATLACDQFADDYFWICATCFEDFREHFNWKLVPNET